jgi:hypothetical protein
MIRTLGTFTRLVAVATFGLTIMHTIHAHAASDFPPFDALPEVKSLPDPFTMLNGSPVVTAQDWREKRRPELVRLIQHYQYGFAPEPDSIDVREEAPVATVMGGKAKLYQYELAIVGLPETAPRIHMALFVPASSTGKAPVFLGINDEGNHAVVPDEAVVVSPGVFYKDDPVARGARAEFWCVEYLIDRGYAFATFRETDLDPDMNDFTDGIHAQYPNLPWTAAHRWGTIRSWAWGFHRCVDVLVTLPTVDPAKIAVIGHSRRGKTALLAAALDERIALCVPHQSGTGGCALSRDNDQETVKRINTNFPHWFNDAFPNFNDNESRIPFDQHLLIALVAPRALLDTEGAQDKWANPPAALRAIEAASPVWEVLGARMGEGPLLIESNADVQPGKVGPLHQLRLDHKHTLNKDFWEGILNYADVVFGNAN